MADQAAMSVIANAVSTSTQSKWIRALMSCHPQEGAQNKRVADLLTGQGVDLLEKRGWDDRAGDMIEV